MFLLKDNEFSAKQYIENYFYIVDRQKEKRPFIFNSIQNKLFQEQTHKDLVLKYRKGGISSLVLAEWLCACLFEDNTRAVVISHEKEATRRLLDRVYYYIDNLAIKPKLDKASTDEIRFPQTNSSFYIGTAGSKAFGRGDDISHLHISEFDWWEHTEMLTGLIEACIKDSWIVIETTANGFNSESHQLWQRAKAGKSEFNPLFFGWNMADECKMAVVDKDFKLTMEEFNLKKAYNLTDDQLNWRRWKLRSMDRPELFVQEFPINDVEAFLFSGRNYFNTARLKLYLDNCSDPLTVGHLLKKLDRIEFIPAPTGGVKIYKKPNPGKVYVLGADCAEGIGADFSAITVYDPIDNEVVAIARFDIVASEFGREMAKLGQYYNWGVITCEVNNHGLTALTVLKEQEQYPQIYYRRTVDKANNLETEQIGWKTTETTRPLLLDKLDKAIRDGLIGIPSKDVIEELMSFIINKNGKPEAQPGANDDFVISTALAFYAAPLARAIRKPEQQETKLYTNKGRWR